MRHRALRNTFARLLAVMVTTMAAAPLAAETDPVGTAFTYQGRLTLNGVPVEGTVDLVFRLFDVQADGVALSVLVADGFPIGEDGRFTIDLDFGDEFTGAARWIEIAVDGATLAPRQPLMAAPHAIVATTAAFVPGKAVVGQYGGITGVGTLNALNVGGKVGIGTTVPQAQLHVSGQGSSEIGFSVEHPGTSTGLFQIGSPAGHLGIAAWANNGNRRDIRFTDTGLALSVNTSGNLPATGTGLFVHESGNVGVGTLSPTARLHVVGASGTSPALRATSVGGAGVTGTGFFGVNGTAANPDSGYGGSFGGAGFLGIGRALLSWGDSHLLGKVGIATDAPEYPLHVASGPDASPSGGGFVVVGKSNDLNIAIDSNEIMARNNGGTSSLLLNRDGGDVVIGSASGGTSRVITPVLQITGGADLAERFDIASLDGTLPSPGMVVCIDPTNPGKLVTSTRAYDRTVAGVISGANGIRSGMVMGQEDSVADGAHAVALTGRVYVRATAFACAIEPGDLLTTSDTAGHAMKVRDHALAQGAVIGKAMTALAAGETGMVLVLVSLQ